MPQPSTIDTGAPPPATRRHAAPDRRRLEGGWSFAPDLRPAGERVAPPATGWRALDAPRPVAAALQALGEWSIDGPARRFDAECWWYRCRIDTPSGMEGGPLRLGLDGLATRCTAWIDGREVLRSTDMFLAHEVALPAAPTRELLLRFDPLDEALAVRRPRARWRTPMVAHPQLRHERTALPGRVPGWWPDAAVVGPWRGAWLEPLVARGVQVLHRVASLDDDGRTGRLALAVHWLAADEADGVEAVITCDDGTTFERPLARTADGAWSLDPATTGRFDEVQAWWPATHGTPARYRLQLRARSRDELAHLGHVGFRRVAFVDPANDAALHLNGVEIFARGVCWTPADAVGLDGRADVDAALGAAVGAQVRLLAEAGANLVRVSGATCDVTDAFLDACDEHGVMAWLEPMLASQDVPLDDAAFRAQLDAELSQSLARWRAHACVAVVCGNSEISQQAAMAGAPADAWTHPWFSEVLPARVREAMGDVPVVPSSAQGGAFPHQPSAGTCSYYGVGAYGRPIADARDSRVRFATECLGFAQVPDDAALARLAASSPGLPLRPHTPAWKARVPRDLGAGWDFDDVRDAYVERLYGLDAAARRALEPARAWALARAATAEAMGRAFDHWRAADARCRGALAWFLRDPRAGAGWGVLDEQGHPKAAFHALARAWRPLHVGVTDEGLDGTWVHVVNELPAACRGTLTLRAFLNGEVPVGDETMNIDLAPRQKWRTCASTAFEGLRDLTGAYGFGPPSADVLVATLHDDTGTLRAQAVHVLDGRDGPRPLQQRELGLAATWSPSADGHGVDVEIRTRAAARAVHLDAPGWRADDEYFPLAPGATRRLTLRPVEATTTADAFDARVTAIDADRWTPAVRTTEGGRA